MRPWILLPLLSIVACATGVTTGAVDDDGGGGGVGVGGAGGTSSTVGGAASSGGTGGVSNGGASGDVIWINEIHYDNDGADVGEGVEVAGQAGVDLTRYELEFYNTGTTYNVVPLTGTLPDQQSGFGTSWVAVTDIQNGPSDGVALIDTQTSQVVLFLGYEGAIAATDGQASGMTSIDIGVDEMETNTTMVGESLQLTGTGNSYSSFTWSAPTTSSPGQPNGSQTLQ